MENCSKHKNYKNNYIRRREHTYTLCLLCFLMPPYVHAYVHACAHAYAHTHIPVPLFRLLFTFGSFAKKYKPYYFLENLLREVIDNG